MLYIYVVRHLKRITMNNNSAGMRVVLRGHTVMVHLGFKCYSGAEEHTKQQYNMRKGSVWYPAGKFSERGVGYFNDREHYELTLLVLCMPTVSRQRSLQTYMVKL